MARMVKSPLPRASIDTRRREQARTFGEINRGRGTKRVTYIWIVRDKDVMLDKGTGYAGFVVSAAS
jgi:hypothetical protein